MHQRGRNTRVELSLVMHLLRDTASVVLLVSLLCFLFLLMLGPGQVFPLLLTHATISLRLLLLLWAILRGNVLLQGPLRLIGLRRRAIL
jgi:hypothetical protein